MTNFVSFLQSGPTGTEVVATMHGDASVLDSPEVADWFQEHPDVLAAVIKHRIDHGGPQVLEAALRAGPDFAQRLASHVPAEPSRVWLAAIALLGSNAIGEDSDCDFFEWSLNERRPEWIWTLSLVFDGWTAQRRRQVFRRVLAQCKNPYTVVQRLAFGVRDREDAEILWPYLKPTSAFRSLEALGRVAAVAPDLVISALGDAKKDARVLMRRALLLTDSAEAVDSIVADLTDLPFHILANGFHANPQLRERLISNPPKAKKQRRVFEELQALWERRDPDAVSIEERVFASATAATESELIRDLVRGRWESTTYFDGFDDPKWAALAKLVDRAFAGRQNLKQTLSAAWKSLSASEARTPIAEYALASIAPLAIDDDPDWSTLMTETTWALLADRAAMGLNGFGSMLINHESSRLSESRSTLNFTMDAPAAAAPWLVEAVAQIKPKDWRATGIEKFVSLGDAAVDALAARLDLMEYADKLAFLVGHPFRDERLRVPLESALALKPPKKQRVAIESALQRL